jgi:hypothetical protein
MRKVRGAIAAAAVVLAAVGFAQSGAGRALLRDTGLEGRTPSYTALSFANPGELPTQLYSPAGLMPTAFTIRNSSAQQRHYPWQIEEIRNGQVRQLASGQATVPPGAARTINRSFVTSCTGGRIKIEVSLPGAGESIGFWTTCFAGGTP